MNSKLTKFEGKPGSNELITFTQDQLDLIKSTIAKDATNDELKLFLYQCKRSGLDPMVKQIYFQKYKSKNGHSNMTIITGIDGYRLIAARSNAYAGNKEPVYEGEIEIKDGAAYDLIKTAPRKATVTVMKFAGGTKCDFTASAFWEEYYPGGTKGHMWRKFPYTMLAKCAEAQALRKAFPNDLSGLYTTEEMDQASSSNLVGERVEKVISPPPLPDLDQGTPGLLRFDEEAWTRAEKFLVEKPHKVDCLIKKIKETYLLDENSELQLRQFATKTADSALTKEPKITGENLHE